MTHIRNHAEHVEEALIALEKHGNNEAAIAQWHDDYLTPEACVELPPHAYDRLEAAYGKAVRRIWGVDA